MCCTVALDSNRQEAEHLSRNLGILIGRLSDDECESWNVLCPGSDGWVSGNRMS